VPGARDVAIEFGSLSKSHSMAGWRVGFAAGNPDIIHALGRIKSYLDYGMPTPIQVGAIVALRGPQDCVTEAARTYRDRRDALIEGLGAPGDGQWKIEKPLATMFVWAPIPEPLRQLGSLEFAKRLMVARRSPYRPVSASARWARASCASRWSRIVTGSARPCAASAASCGRPAFER
jgi:alanine-synthesizing transaminase